jgi:DNA-binding NtrC family response regulator
MVPSVPSVPSVTGLRDWINIRGWLHREPKPVIARKILIVDSNASNLSSTARMIESLGFETLQTRGATEAFKLLEDEDPEFVLLAFDLADGSGMQALSQIRELAPELPIVMLAADLWDSRVAEAMRRGAIAYLARPFDRNDLRELLGRHA